ncbi:MAG: two component transcriptional regulator, LuxR family [Pseudonocardiales bacterium]|nr:two component transcriptional regulator, LuxR family [Pseudonocardiales bacterium]
MEVGPVVTSIADAATAVADRQVDVIIADVQSARDASSLTHLRAPSGGPPVILVARKGDEGRATDVLRAGVRAWVERSDSTEKLLAVIFGVMRGETWVPPRLLTDVLASYVQKARVLTPHQRALSTLTPREREILDAMADGCSRAEIAQRFFLSPNTVRTHAQNILRKLDVSSAVGAVAIARLADQASAESSDVTPIDRHR